MKQNNSPWLTQLDHERATLRLEQDIKTQVAIVGGGIAGITTLYYLLRHTDKKIILLEGSKIAHGATGHNAGYIVAEFEKPLTLIAKEHGIKKTVAGMELLEASWELIEEIFSHTQITVPYHELIGYGGYCEIDQLIADIETEYFRHEHGLSAFPILIARESGWYEQIPEKFKSVCEPIDHKILLEYLDTKNTAYQAVIAHKKAVMNSALFTETLALWCLNNFPNRVSLYEHSFVHGIELEHAQPVVITNDAKIVTDEIILCTNGFENFYIHDRAGTDIDTKFHHQVEGAVGYMTGFLSNDLTLPYMANYYYEAGKRRGSDPFSSDPYFYVTRRDFSINHVEQKLFSLGGPEIQLVDREIYLSDIDVSEKFHNDSLRFSREHFINHNEQEAFFWHGLMGYTRSGLRMVGREPLDHRLLYNLGCNGIGILSSIMGARKIARHIAGEQVPESIFDPKR